MAVPIHTEGYSWFQQKSETFAAQLSNTVPLTGKIYTKYDSKGQKSLFNPDWIQLIV